MDNKPTNMDEERLRVLRMVEEGKLNAAEGINLLETLTQGQKSSKAQPRASAGGPQWFRVHVTDLDTGRSKATVNIPLSLMDWGLRIGAKFAPEVADYNLSELTRLLREDGINGKIIDVVDEDDGEHVEIFVE
jgi:SHOCT-like domain